MSKTIQALNGLIDRYNPKDLFNVIKNESNQNLIIGRLNTYIHNGNYINFNYLLAEVAIREKKYDVAKFLFNHLKSKKDLIHLFVTLAEKTDEKNFDEFTQLMKVLIDKKEISPYEKNIHGLSPIISAYYLGNVELIKWFDKNTKYTLLGQSEDYHNQLLNVTAGLHKNHKNNPKIKGANKFELFKHLVNKTDPNVNQLFSLLCLSAQDDKLFMITKYITEEKKCNLFQESSPYNPFILAAYNGAYKSLEFLIKKVDYQGKLLHKTTDKWNFFHFLVRHQDKDFIKGIVDLLMSPVEEQKFGKEFIKKLLEEPNGDGYTPLYLSLSDKNKGQEKALYLLEQCKSYEVDIHQANEKDGWTPLIAAFHGRYLKVVKAIIESTKDSTKLLYKTTDKCNFFHYLVKYADKDYIEDIVGLLTQKFVKKLLEEPYDDGRTPLYLSLHDKNKTEEKLVYLLKLCKSHEVDIHQPNETSGWTPLMLASDKGYLKAVKAIIKSTKDSTKLLHKNKYKLNFFHYLVKYQDKDFIKDIVDLFMSPVEEEKFGEKFIKKLLEEPNGKGYTPLYLSLYDKNNTEEKVLYLLELCEKVKADIHQLKEADGWTFLMEASEKGYLKVVKTIIKSATFEELLQKNVNNLSFFSCIVESQDKKSIKSVVDLLIERFGQNNAQMLIDDANTSFSLIKIRLAAKDEGGDINKAQVISFLLSKINNKDSIVPYNLVNSYAKRNQPDKKAIQKIIDYALTSNVKNMDSYDGLQKYCNKYNNEIRPTILTHAEKVNNFFAKKTKNGSTIGNLLDKLMDSKNSDKASTQNDKFTIPNNVIDSYKYLAHSNYSFTIKSLFDKGTINSLNYNTFVKYAKSGILYNKNLPKEIIQNIFEFACVYDFIANNNADETYIMGNASNGDMIDN